jgi:hypothetical protein
MRRKRQVHRSGFEDRVIASLRACNLPFTYESHKIRYVVPASEHTYTPDIVLPNGVLIELKGYLDADARKKYVLVKSQSPDLDLRFVFQNASKPIRKGSKTSYGIWATKNGFIWSQGSVPTEWWTD